LREVEKRTGIIAGFAECFTDHRDAEAIEHTVGSCWVNGSMDWAWDMRI
jgi:hypothetical protein